jgi:hypothetical protein
MRRRPFHQIEPTMATNFPSLSRGIDLNPNVHMFVEDVHLSVMPIGGRTQKRQNFTVTLHGEKEECERASNLIGEFGEFDKYDLAGMVCDAIENIAKRLAWEGRAVYEIIPDKAGVMHVHGFASKRLIRLPGWFLQIIPRGDWQLWGKKWVIIPVSKIFYLEMPMVLGGYKGYKRILKGLRRFEHIGPPFWRRDLESGIQSRAFDFQRYVRSSEIYYGRITRAWGWNRRDWSQERSMEFFNFYKMVTFHWAQSVLREDITAEVNRLLSRLSIVCEMKVTGLPTSSEILKIRRELQEGTITFAQASDRVSL